MKRGNIEAHIKWKSLMCLFIGSLWIYFGLWVFSLFQSIYLKVLVNDFWISDIY